MIIIFFVAVSFAACNRKDALIFREKGVTFPTLFRSFGGLWTSRTRYERKIRNQVGLSRVCASCYGQAYVCGFHSCKWPCKVEGSECDTCLHEAGCIEACEKCTKWSTHLGQDLLTPLSGLHVEPVREGGST